MQGRSHQFEQDVQVDIDIEDEPGAFSQVQRVADLIRRDPGSRGERLEVARWLVYVEGGQVVGPVTALQIAQGMRAGKVPSDASIQAVGEVFWTGLLDEPAVIAALKLV